MFKDISQLAESDDSEVESDDSTTKADDSEALHFMATVVGLCRDTITIGTEMIRTNRYDVIEVVDGQQRLTTLVLLLKSIECKIKSLLSDEKWRQRFTGEDVEQAERERKELANLLVHPADQTQVLLQTNHDSSEYFANYLINGKLPPDSEEISTLADKELLSAIKECQRFVNRWDNIFELLDIIKNKLYFIFHEITDEASVYTVFEVLNNRGLYVSWLDRFKSQLMAVVYENDAGNRDEHIEHLHRIWGDIYATVGLNQRLNDETLKFTATLKGNPVGKTVQEEDSVTQLMREVGTNPTKTIEVSNWVLEVSKAMKRVYDIFSPSKDVLIDIIQVRMLATAIFLMKESRRLIRKEEVDLLNQLEKTSFRIFGLSRAFGSHKITAQTERGNYLRLANTITNGKDISVDQTVQRIKQLGVNYSFGSIESRDCYNEWTDELRYLLYCYEQYLAESQGKRFTHEEWNSIWKGSAVNSIEHIHPQSKAGQIEISVHRIGNLLLLPPEINSGLSDKYPIEKAQAYRNTRLISAEVVAETIETRGWDDEAIVGQSYEIAEWVNETFSG